MKLLKHWGLVMIAGLTFVLSGCGGSGSSSLIGFTVKGLSTGTTLTLVNNGANPITVSTNGTFAFSVPIASGSSYSVAVYTPPIGQVCTIANGNGVVDSSGNPVANITVTCTSNIATGNAVFGYASGIPSGKTVTLTNNGSDTVTVTANGAFAFPTQVAIGTSYTVAIKTNATGLQCALANATGTIPSSGSITPVQLTCS